MGMEWHIGVTLNAGYNQENLETILMRGQKEEEFIYVDPAGFFGSSSVRLKEEKSNKNNEKKCVVLSPQEAAKMMLQNVIHRMADFQYDQTSINVELLLNTSDLAGARGNFTSLMSITFYEMILHGKRVMHIFLWDCGRTIKLDETGKILLVLRAMLNAVSSFKVVELTLDYS